MKQLYVKYDKKDILKAVEIVGSKAKLARYLSDNNALGIIVNDAIIWKLLNTYKSMNKFIKLALDELLLKNIKKKT